MLTDRFRNRHEDHADLLQLGLEGGGDRNGIEHGVDGDAAGTEISAGALVVKHARLALFTHASEDLLLLQRYAELFVGSQNFRIDLIKRLRCFERLRRRVVVDALIVDRWIIYARPCRLAQDRKSVV